MASYKSLRPLLTNVVTGTASGKLSTPQIQALHAQVAEMTQATGVTHVACFNRTLTEGGILRMQALPMCLKP